MEDTSRVRMRVLGVVAVSLFLALFGRLWYLQALESERFEVRAESNITRSIRTQAPRGQILDRNGRVLVENRLSTVVTINRDEHVQVLRTLGFDTLDKRSEFRGEMFADLARELSQSGQLTKVAGLERSFGDRSFTSFDDIPIARDVDEELLIFIGERPDRFPGVKVDQDVVRSYPFGDKAAHILGYVGSITGGELEAKDALYLIDDPEVDDPSVKIEDPTGKQYRSNDEIGKQGIEAFFEDDLRGIPGTREILVDNFGNLVDLIEERSSEPVPGSDVQLTIDIDLQVRLEFELKRALDRARGVEVLQDEEPFRAPAGSAVIMDPRDGSILAMASYPTFDPGDFIDGISQAQFDKLSDPLEHQPLLNRAVAEIYPAASTFKPFTAIAAEVFNVFGWRHVEPWQVPTSDPGYWDLVSCNIDFTGDVAGALGSGCRKRNAGDASMEGVDLRHSLTFSSDTYYYKLGEAFWIAPDGEIDPQGIQKIAGQFGLGSESGVQLPNEKGGIMPNAEQMRERHLGNPEAFPRGDWGPGDNTNLAIGQGEVAITPLQLANAYAVIANGGTVFSPNIVSTIVPPTDDEEPIVFGPRVAREFDIPDTIEQEILDGLIGVTMQPKPDLTQPSGTGFDAFNYGPDSQKWSGGVEFDLINWPVAGKTGTAEILGRADNSMFVGFGPSGSSTFGTAINEPEYVMVVILEESGFGSRHAAPMVARTFDAIANDSISRALTQDEIDSFYGVDQITDLDLIATAIVEGEIDQ
jgi:penicillin-binding protein 2